MFRLNVSEKDIRWSQIILRTASLTFRIFNGLLCRVGSCMSGPPIGIWLGKKHKVAHKVRINHLIQSRMRYSLDHHWWETSMFEVSAGWCRIALQQKGPLPVFDKEVDCFCSNNTFTYNYKMAFNSLLHYYYYNYIIIVWNHQLSNHFLPGVHCGPPPEVIKSRVTVSGHYYNDTAVYECLSGYRLRGNATIVCGHDGNWTAAPDCSSEQTLI